MKFSRFDSGTETPFVGLEVLNSDDYEFYLVGYDAV
jgi:hypothetical protein